MMGRVIEMRLVEKDGGVIPFRHTVQQVVIEFDSSDKLEDSQIRVGSDVVVRT